VEGLTAIFASAAEGAPFLEMTNPMSIFALHRVGNEFIDDEAVPR